MIAEISPTSPVLVWFRKDLRLQDNPSLNAALEANREIIPLFVWDEEEGGKMESRLRIPLVAASGTEQSGKRY